MIRVLIADDHAIIRDGLRQVISFVPNMTVVGEAADGEELLRTIVQTPADVLVMDMSMPGKNGIALIAQIKSLRKTLPVLVLSMHRESQYAVQAIRAGASGYITKNMASNHLIEGISKLARGGTCISDAVAQKLLQQLQQPEKTLPHTTLTPREFQTFQMLIEGQSVNRIAQTLCVSNKTISTHKANILEKLDVTTTAGLVYYALRHGLINEGFGLN